MLEKKSRFKNKAWDELTFAGCSNILINGKDYLSIELEKQGLVYEDMPYTELKVNQKGV